MVKEEATVVAVMEADMAEWADIEWEATVVVDMEKVADTEADMEAATEWEDSAAADMEEVAALVVAMEANTDGKAEHSKHTELESKPHLNPSKPLST